MFDFSFAELVLIGIGCYVFVGPKHVPTVAHMIGRGLGRAVGFVNRGRDFIGEAMKDRRLKHVYNSELAKGLRQFGEIQRELQSAQINPIYSVQCNLCLANVIACHCSVIYLC